MPTCDHLQRSRIRLTRVLRKREREGEFEDLASRGSEAGAVNFYCKSPSPFVSSVFDDFISGTRDVYKSLVVRPFHNRKEMYLVARSI